MRIQELALKAFGPFTDIVVDLGAPNGSVNVLFGENEAGKSTALRALEGLCFGIPERTADDHVHKSDQMRVGATLLMEDGTTHSLVRRKGRKNTLTSADGTEVTEQELERMLCGVGKSGFEALFCLSYQRLTEASDDLLLEGGELGKLLFEARSDLGLKSLMSTLEARSSALYRGTARSNSVIDESLRTYDGMRQILRKGDLAEYDGLRAKIAKLQLEAGQVKEELLEFRTSRQRLERLQAVAPAVRKYLRDTQSLTELGPIPRLGAGFAEEFSAASTLELKAEATHTAATEYLVAIAANLSHVAPNVELLEWQSEIERLNTQVQQILNHQSDIPKQDRFAADALAESRTLLATVRPGEAPDEAELSLGIAQNRISALGRDRAKLDQELAGARDEISRLEPQIRTANERLDECSDVKARPGLSRAVSSARALGDAEARLSAMQHDLRTLRVDTEIQCARLGAGNRTVREFVNSVGPLREVIEAFASEWREAEERVRSCATDIREEQNRHSTLVVERTRLLAEGDIPNESDLSDVRGERENSWKKIKAKISAVPLQKVEEVEIVQFEANLESADALSDRLREHATRSAFLSKLDAELATTEVRMGALDEEKLNASILHDEVKRRWHERCDVAGIIPDAPQQKLAWLRRFEDVVQDVTRVEELAQEAKDLDLQIAAACTAIRDALSISDDGASLGQLLREADELGAIEERNAGLKAGLKKQINDGMNQLRGLQESICEIESRRLKWEHDWLTETACLKLSRTPSPEEADVAMKAISEAGKRMEAARNAEKRSAAMRRDVQEFSDATAKVVAAVERNSLGLPAVDAVRKLTGLLKDAVELEGRRAALISEQNNRQQALEASALDLSLAEAALKELCNRASCQDISELDAVVIRHSHSERLEKAIRENAELIAVQSGGRPLEEFCGEVAATDDDSILIQLNEAKIEIEPLEQRLEVIHTEIGALQSSLAVLDNQNKQLESQMTAESALARVRSSVRPYLVYSLAETLIRSQIEEFRKAHQGPILRKAGEIFSDLTNGSFETLSSDLDDKDRPLLVANRISPQTGAVQNLRVDALSSATRIGLYLSLRLACLYHHLDQKEGLPFVADDILLDFDDIRARRVMHQLGALAERTQVILFTHHRHLVDIAQAVLGDRSVVSDLRR